MRIIHFNKCIIMFGIAALCCNVQQVSAQTSWTIFEEFTLDGDGSETNPYQLRRSIDLHLFKNKVENGQTDACAVVACNIDMAELIVVNEDSYIFNVMKPINYYTGVFDGKGHAISNLQMDGGGLFNENNGTIQNLTLSGSALGGMFCVVNEKRIINCINYGTVTGLGNDYVGGICARNNWIVSSCINYGTVSGGGGSGGIMGMHSGDNTICKRNSNFAAVSGNTAGGIVGTFYAMNSTLKECQNSATITSTENGGGIIGECLMFGGTITSCTNKGHVTGKYAGGILGSYYPATITMKDCMVEACQIIGTERAAAIVGYVESEIIDGKYVPKSTLEYNYYLNGTVVTTNGVTYNGDSERGIWHKVETGIDNVGGISSPTYEYIIADYRNKNGAVLKGRISVNGNPNITVTGVPTDVPYGDTPDTSNIVVKDGDSTLTEGCDYNIEVDTDAGTITIVFDGEYDGDIVYPYTSTGINDIVTSEHTDNASGIFDLSGKKMPTEKLTKGVYIINGKKVILK